MSTLKAWIRGNLPISLQVPTKYWYERCSGLIEPEIALLNDIVKPEQIALDIGANRGVYSYALWRIGAVVHAFEPNPQCLEVLRAWAAEKQRIHIHPLAVSDRVGTAELVVPTDSGGVTHDASGAIGVGSTEESSIRVQTATLESVGLEDVAFIKIDVEGHEKAVLSGADQILLTYRPSLLVEIEQRHHKESVLDVFDWVFARNYAAFFLRQGRLHSYNDFNAQRDQVWLGPGTYINNFLFLNRERLTLGEYAALQTNWGLNR